MKSLQRLPLLELSDRAINQVVIEAKYAGYLRRQLGQIEKQAKTRNLPIPTNFNYQAIPQLRCEAKEKLTLIQPQNLGQAERISGITPADLAVVMIYLDNPQKLPKQQQ